MLALLVPVRAGAGSEHRGAWVDEIVVSEEGDAARAVNMLQADRLDVYAVGISDPVLHRKIQDSEELGSDISYGTAVELTFNPAGPAFGEGALNPFHVPEVREAMNWLIDREHIAQEIYGGLARPRYLPINTVFPDYARLVKTARQLEIRYGHDPDRAERVIAREMRELGARRVDGTWRYEDEPVRLKFLIRLDDRRREVGDYIANELEDIGFQVVRDYRTAAEAAPIWIGSDPSEGRWHLYTGGWVSTGISRDEATVFNTFFTPRGRPDPLWQSYTPSKRFDRLADRLARRDYETLAQRREMMAEALKLAMQNSARIWLVDQKSIWPRRSEVEVAADLAGGMAGSRLWPLTVRFEDRTGGRMRIATSSILTEPWNPVAGSNWIFDTMVIRATADSALMPDPFTGLAWPQRIRGATVHVRQGLPVRSTHDWVELEFESSISVPEDVWIDWDAESKEFVTAGQKHPKGITARTRTVVRYERDLFERMWHDGTTVSLADALAGLILTFERAKQASALYDEAAVSAFETFMRHFKGLRILQEDPLVVEVYSDHLHRDAEMIAFSRASYLFPAYRSGTAPWHMVALGIRAERAGDLAFSKSKSDRMDVEHMSFVSGPSLRILDGHLRKAREQGYVPFEDVLGEYVEQGEAERRYERLARWRKEKGHFWVGMGPFQLEAVHPTQGVIVLHRFEGFRDRSDKWLRFAEPPDPEVRVSASSSRITTGSEAAFDIRLRCGEAPCEREDITFVRYLVFDGRNKLALSGRAEPAGRGRWRVRLDGEQTAALRPGSNRIEVAVSSKRMAIPSFGSASFVTMPPLEGGE
jgi:peptide/nickel transport system substrate-binding protein